MNASTESKTQQITAESSGKVIEPQVHGDSQKIPSGEGAEADAGHKSKACEVGGRARRGTLRKRGIGATGAYPADLQHDRTDLRAARPSGLFQRTVQFPEGPDAAEYGADSLVLFEGGDRRGSRSAGTHHSGPVTC